MRARQESPPELVIDHYLGEKGRAYFAWQGADGNEQARYNRHFWQPWCSAHDDVLDFGCGGGFLLAALDVRRRAGVEINPAACERARALGIEVYSRIEDVPGRFDRVISSHALEHVPHPRQALAGLADKLRDERSRLLLLLPLDDWRSRANRRFRPGDRSMHLQTWTPQLLGNLLSSCELEVDEVRVVTHAWPPGRKLWWRLSPALFHRAACAWSIVNKQRQLFAVARLRPGSRAGG